MGIASELFLLRQVELSLGFSAKRVASGGQQAAA
jgi:hypothetical protein